MNGIDATLVVAFFFILIVALAVGGLLAARNPKFWIEATAALAAAAWPKIVEYVTRRNTPEIEAKMAECVRRGGEWDNFNKRCRHK